MPISTRPEKKEDAGSAGPGKQPTGFQKIEIAKAKAFANEIVTGYKSMSAQQRIVLWGEFSNLIMRELIVGRPEKNENNVDDEKNRMVFFKRMRMENPVAFKKLSEHLVQFVKDFPRTACDVTIEDLQTILKEIQS